MIRTTAQLSSKMSVAHTGFVVFADVLFLFLWAVVGAAVGSGAVFLGDQAEFKLIKRRKPLTYEYASAIYTVIAGPSCAGLC